MSLTLKISYKLPIQNPLKTGGMTSSWLIISECLNEKFKFATLLGADQLES